MKKLVLAIATLAISAMSASAADMAPRTYTKAPPMAPVMTYDWSGFYIGGQIGGDGSTGEYLINNPTVRPRETLSFNPSSFIGGGHLGVQGQWGNWVVGVEGTYSATTLKQTDPSIFSLLGRFNSLNTRDVATVVGKVGYASGPWMGYVKGGFADSKIEISGFSIFNPGVVDGNSWTAGYTIGGGIDYMFAKSWIAGVDFNYYDFRFNRDLLATFSLRPGNYSGRDQVYAGMFRLSYLFNFATPVVAKY